MQVGRFFQGLTAYDLLGNLVPGVTLLTALSLFLPSPWFPSSVGGYALFVVCSYVLGGMIQTHASAATGSRVDFERSIDARQGRLGDLEITDEGSGTPSESGRGLDFGQLCRLSFLSPLSLGSDGERGSPVVDRLLASRIQQHLYTHYGVEPDAGSFDVLYRLMLSEVGDGRSTAVRMQALRNLYRGMWMAAWYTLVLLAGSFVVEHTLVDCTSLPIGFATPGYYHHWSGVWQLLVLAPGVVIFLRYIAAARDRKFVEYLFTDYAATVSLPQDPDTDDERGATERKRGYD